MSLEIELKDVLSTSQTLGSLADSYDPVISALNDIMISPDIFEKSDMSTTWSDLISEFWGYCADSQDNFNETSRTLVRYINAVCADDTQNGKDLADQIDDHNTALDNTEKGQDGKSGTDDDIKLDSDPLQEPDTDNPDQMFDEPEFDEATRPEGNASK